MNLKQLQSFVAIYEAGGISRAAEQERSAPSVLSHHLANLEARVQCALFIRSRHGLKPTPQGDRLYEHAKQVFTILSTAKKELLQWQQSYEGTVAIGMAYTSVEMIGKDLMEMVIKEYPGIDLTISETVSGSTLQQLFDAKIDLALAYNPTQDAVIRSMPLIEERMVFVGKAEIVGDPTLPLPVEELLRLPFILLRKGVTGRSIMDNPSLQKSLEQHATMATDNVSAVHIFLREGFGGAIATLPYALKRVQDSGLVYREIIEPEVRRTLYLCEHVDTATNQAIELIKERLLFLVRQAVLNGKWECERLLF